MWSDHSLLRFKQEIHVNRERNKLIRERTTKACTPPKDKTKFGTHNTRILLNVDPTDEIITLNS